MTLLLPMLWKMGPILRYKNKTNKKQTNKKQQQQTSNHEQTSLTSLTIIGAGYSYIIVTVGTFTISCVKCTLTKLIIVWVVIAIDRWNRIVIWPTIKHTK